MKAKDNKIFVVDGYSLMEGIEKYKQAVGEMFGDPPTKVMDRDGVMTILNLLDKIVTASGVEINVEG